MKQENLGATPGTPLLQEGEDVNTATSSLYCLRLNTTGGRYPVARHLAE